jgi:phosphopantetheinyl transferase
MSGDTWSAAPERPTLPPTAVHVWRSRAANRDEARMILRRLLARYDGVDPEAIRFAEGPHGKPALSTTTDLRFNLSHTKGLALYAFARGTEVGIDVERARQGLDTVRLAGRFINPAEADNLKRLEPEQRDAAFLRAWVRYEATVKCLGTGIGGRNINQPLTETAPWVREIDPGPKAAAAAIAVADGPRTLSLYEWATTAEP